MLRIGGVPLSQIRAPRYHYVDIVRQICGPNLIGYWPLNEASGSVAADLSGNGRNGAYAAVTLGRPGIGDGFTAASFDGSTSFCNIYSAGLAGAFNGAEGTVLVWAKVANAGVWTDATYRRFVRISGANLRDVLIAKLSAANNIIEFRHKTDTDIWTQVTTSSTDWMCLAFSWSVAGGFANAYYNGALQASSGGAIGTWGANALDTTGCCVGAANTGGAQGFSGLEAHAVLCNRALTTAEIATLSRLP